MLSVKPFVVAFIAASLLLFFSLGTYHNVFAEDPVPEPKSELVHIPQPENNENENPRSRDSEGTVSMETAVEGDSLEEFIPTNRWQTVKPRQSVPPGLHIRMNLATGEKEAKLLNPNLDAEAPKIDTNQLKHAFSRIALTEDDVKSLEGGGIDTSNQPSVSTRFRSYDELKADFEKMNLNVKTDAEILRGLMTEYFMKNCSLERQLEILYDVEYYVHQIDNALTFIDLQGLDLVKAALNSSNSDFRANGAFILGSATQSNPKAQIAAVEAGLLHQLVKAIPSETTPEVLSRLIYALSSLLRHFPYAQQKFLELGGSEVFSAVLSREKESVFTVKHQLKVVTLVSDLLNEQTDAEKALANATANKSELLVERVNQYRKVKWMPPLVEQNWCNDMFILLYDCETNENYDCQEKVLLAFNLMIKSCDLVFYSSAHTRALFGRLQDKYEAALTKAEPEEMDYLKDLLKLVTPFVPLVTPQHLFDEMRAPKHAVDEL